MKKKTKLILMRIFACVLVLILALGIIAPVVASATEMKPGVNANQGTAAMPQVEENTNGDGDGAPSAPPMTKPDKAVSAGFEYVKVGDAWVVQKAAGNTEAAIIIDGMPDEGFDNAYITLFIGNMETKEIKTVELMNDYSFTKSVALEDGYYVIFANKYAFANSKNNAYAINGGEFKYFHIGADFDNKKFPVSFTDANTGLIHLSLKAAPDGYETVQYNQRISLSAADLVFPDEAILGKIEDSKLPTNTDDTTNNSSEEQKANADDQTTQENGNSQNEDGAESIWQGFLHTLSRSSFLIFCIIVCFIGTTIIKAKKQSSLEEQAESDKNDDGHIL